MSGRPGDIQSRLIELVHSSSMLMRALRAARAVEPPDWLIGAGVIRDLVWDHLHGFDRTRRPKDVDLVFFDPGSLGSDRERSVLREVTAEAPDICWDVTNQAGVHLWYPQVFGVEVQPLASSPEGVATWPETATAVAIRLLADDSIQVIAPCGLEDLFGLVCRRNPRRVTVEEYQRRVQGKRVAERWPRVLVLRSAAEENIASVLGLWETAGGTPSVSDTRDGLSRLLACDRDALVLAESGGVVVGSLIAAWDGWRGSFYKLVVHPDHRRQGLATELLREGERHLRARGAVRLTAIVAEDDPGAMGFWRAAGYARQRDRVRFVRIAED
jgi:N-acetylglutamate synthase-like GNAT family acetyltransferase